MDKDVFTCIALALKVNTDALLREYQLPFPQITVMDAACYLYSRLGGNVSVTKLHSLCYIAQGFHLATFHFPIFAEEFFAWKFGPVCEYLQEHIAPLFAGTLDTSHFDENMLSSSRKMALDFIIENMGTCSDDELQELVMQDMPWMLARRHARDDAHPAKIDMEFMELCFQQFSCKDKDNAE